MNTVLIVEDEKLIRQGISTMVQHSGVPVETVLECSNGLMALEILQSQRVDVMFTDIRMPKMDGIQLVKKMQELPYQPMTVAVSGYDDFSYAVEMMRAGVKEYILKPVDRAKIREVLQKLEKELEKEKEENRHFHVIGCQQLRQVMLSGHITESGLESTISSFQEPLLYPEYYVLSLEKNNLDLEDGCLDLGETKEGSILVADRAGGPFLLKNELRGSYVGVSALHSGVRQLRTAYLEAQEARKIAFCRCIHHVDCDTAPQADYHSPEEGLVPKITQMIGTNKIREAVRLTEQLLMGTRKGLYAPSVMEESVRALVENISATYQNVLESGEIEELERFRTPWCFSCIDELLEELTGWMLSFHDRIDTQFEDYRNKQKMQQAVEYIRQNYSQDLNMAVVSNYVSMNYSLFSYAFKQYTGTNFVNYLKELRMEEARRLLTQTQLRVIEISQQVGYENEKHFMKVFKNVCGVSPTEYRKNMALMKQ